jgi:hypothetical protein
MNPFLFSGLNILSQFKNKIYCKILLAVFIFTVLFIPSQPLEANEYSKGLEKYAAGDYEAAKEFFTSFFDSVDVVPNNYSSLKEYPWCSSYRVDRKYRAFYWRGWCNYNMRYFKFALKDFKQAKAGNAYENVANLMVNWLNYIEDPNQTDNLNRLMEAVELTEGAKDIFGNINDIIPLIKAIYNMESGASLYKKGDRQTSEKKFENVLKISTSKEKNSKEILNYLKGVSSCWLGDLQEEPSKSVEHFNKAIKSFKKFYLYNHEFIDSNDINFFKYYRALSHFYKGLLVDSGKTTYFNEALRHASSISNNALFDDEKNLLISKIKLLEGNFVHCLSLLNNYNNQNNSDVQNYWKGWVDVKRGLIDTFDKEKLLKAEAYFQNFGKDFDLQGLSCWLQRMKENAAYKAVEITHFFTEDYKNPVFSWNLQDCEIDQESKASLDVILSAKSIYLNPKSELNEYLQFKVAEELISLGMLTGIFDKTNIGKQLINKENDPFEWAITRTIGNIDDQNWEKAEQLLTGFQDSPPLSKRYSENKRVPVDEINYALSAVKIHFVGDNLKAESAERILRSLVDRGSADASYRLATIYGNRRDTSRANIYFSRAAKSQRGYFVNEVERKYGEIKVKPDVQPLPPDLTNKIDGDIFRFDRLCDKTAIEKYLSLKAHKNLITALRKYHKPFILPKLRFIDLAKFSNPSPTLHIEIYGNKKNSVPELTVDKKPWELTSKMDSSNHFISRCKRKVDKGTHNIHIKCNGFFDWKQKIDVYEDEIIHVQLLRKFDYDLNSKSLKGDSIIASVYNGNDLYKLKPFSLIKNSREYHFENDVNPISFVVDSNKLYFLSADEKAIFKGEINKESKTVKVFLFNDTKEFYQPVEIINLNRISRSQFFVLDAENNKIHKIDHTGNLLKKNNHQKKDTFTLPSSISADNRDYIYVADCGNHRVLKFDMDLNHTGFCSIHGLKGKYEIGDKGVPDKNKDGLFFFPLSVAVDGDGLIYVSDLTNRIQIFSQDGTHLNTLKLPDKNKLVSQLYVKGSGKNSELYFIEKGAKDKEKIITSKLWKVFAK